MLCVFSDAEIIIKYYLRYYQALKLKIYIFCNSAGGYFFLSYNLNYSRVLGHLNLLL
jgi:hypothetical protein